jgi:hypothetical protein
MNMTVPFAPQARREGLVIEESEDELLVYDLERHKAHCLERTAALIWQQCDGQSTLPTIIKRLQEQHRLVIDEDVIWITLRRLDRARLLQERVKAPAGLAQRASRRDMMRKVAVIGGLAVFSILAPTAAEAASRNVSCVHVFKNGLPENGQCCNGHKGICHITSDHNGVCGPQSC